ncbi:MAG TPA: glycosyltransferase family 4 protein [Solirubrobacteraceae bacterium]|nr:glycosyltransferase family 4 protein [Solirubrobacteraceae bacterium]
MIRVLYVNDTARVSGAEHSLLVLLGSLSGRVSAVVACPEGELAVAVRRLGVPVRAIPGTDLSARLHARHTVREAARAARTAAAVRSIARDAGADVVHANTPRAGLISVLARNGSGAGPVVHIRDSTPPGRLPRLATSLVARRASAFVATSRFLADQLPAGIDTATVPNAVDPLRFDPGALDRATARARLGLDELAPVMAVVGQISPHKGQADAIRALAIVRRAHPDARLLLVGSVKFASAATRFDNRAYADSLRALSHRLGASGAVHFLGERSDVAEILAAVDVALVPSWYEPFGRVALEAMIMGVPVIVTAVGGTREVVTDGVDGLVLAPERPQTWAAAIESLLDDPERRRAMGARGRARALRDYSPDRHADAILGVYADALGGRRPRHRPRGRRRSHDAVAPEMGI